MAKLLIRRHCFYLDKHIRVPIPTFDQTTKTDFLYPEAIRQKEIKYIKKITSSHSFIIGCLKFDGEPEQYYQDGKRVKESELQPIQTILRFKKPTGKTYDISKPNQQFKTVTSPNIQEKDRWRYS